MLPINHRTRVMFELRASWAISRNERATLLVFDTPLGDYCYYWKRHHGCGSKLPSGLLRSNDHCSCGRIGRKRLTYFYDKRRAFLAFIICLKLKLYYFIDVAISSTHILNLCVISNSLLLWNVCHLVESNILSLYIFLWTFSNLVDMNFNWFIK